MWRIHLDDDGAYLQLAPAWTGWGAAAQIVVLVGSLVAFVSFLVWLSRWDRQLTTPRRAAVLLSLRLAIAVFAWALAVLQPTFVVEQERESPSRVLLAVDRSASMEIADVQRSTTENSLLAQALGSDAESIRGTTRKEMVRRLLTKGGGNLIAGLGESHHVEVTGFGDRTESASVPLPADYFRDAAKEITGTDLSAPLAEALRRGDQANGKLLGVILFSDGQHNRGADPLTQARELGRRKIPVFAIPIGSQTPPADLAVVEVKVPAQLAKDAETVVEAKIRLRGIPAGKIEVRLAAPGAAQDAKLEQTVEHGGKDVTISVPFPIRFAEFGLHRLEVHAKPMADAKEITLDNNRLAAMTRVASDKTRVLLVDSDARWEHYYLAAAFSRDPDVALERVLFQQPRLGSQPEAKLEASGFAKRSLPKVEPNRDDPLWGFDLILLGDVAPEELPLIDRRRLEAYVGERGGTLILHAGKRWQPREFLLDAEDPLAKLTPIANATEVRPKDGFRLRITDSGNLVPFFRLDDTEAENRKIWSEFPRHFWGLAAKPKPGAVVLAEADAGGAKDAVALVVQANYGFGKVLYLGLDSTWRWRYRVGDKHHHRFWGQLVRWAGADPWTPGGNRLVRFGATAPTFRPETEPEAVVRLAESLPLPTSPMRVKAFRREGDKEEPVGVFELPLDAKRSRTWQGSLKGLPPGSYRIEPDMPELRDKIMKDEGPDRRDLFTVQPPGDRESVDLATNYELLSAIAEASGGRLVPVEDVSRLPSMLKRLATKKQERYETRPWQNSPWTWAIFALMLSLLTIEWAGRKWAGLP